MIPLKRGKYVDLIIQQHDAERAGRHYDIRIMPSKGKALSWAVRELPNPSEKTLAVQQPDHDRYWATFEGTIRSGYGKGNVKVVKRTKAVVTDVKHNKISLAVIGEATKTPTEYTLIRPKGQRKNWIIVNHTTTVNKYPVPKGKPKYKKTSFDALRFDNPEEIFSAKIDGAHGVMLLRKNKRPRIFSYRESSRGSPLEYTYKILYQMG